MVVKNQISRNKNVTVDGYTIGLHIGASMNALSNACPFNNSILYADDTNFIIKVRNLQTALNQSI